VTSPWIRAPQATFSWIVAGKGLGVCATQPKRRRRSRRIDLGPVDVLPVQRDAPVDAHAAGAVLHPVEAFQSRRLPAAGRADDGQDLAGIDLETDILQRRGSP
jgi:hypothetical protein